MSALPELNLFEEIQGIANSSDFYTYTQEEFNKTWSHYEEESSVEATKSTRAREQASSLPTPPSSGKSSPTRDAWDPMLWHTRGLEEVELRALAELAASPPLSPSVPSVSSCEVTMAVFEACASKLTYPSLSAGELPLPGGEPRPRQLELREGGPGEAEGGAQGQEGQEGQIVGGGRAPRHQHDASTKKVHQRKKLYEMKAFADPVKERERQNAINAKKNRDRKNSLVSESQSEISQLRGVNRKLSKEAVMNKRRLLAARREIKVLQLRLGSGLLGTCAT